MGESNSNEAQLATSRYQNERLVVRSGRVPIRITAGHPRFRLGYSLAGTISELAPSRSMLAIDDPIVFRNAYESQLDEVGVDVLTQRFDEVLGAEESDRLVLLCFEDISRLGELSCHRRIFAHWWEARTGEEVPELR